MSPEDTKELKRLEILLSLVLNCIQRLLDKCKGEDKKE